MKKFNKNNTFFKEVKEIIPLASQTFSKSYMQYVKGIAPLFIEKAKGAYVRDIDGNKYLDMINGLLPIILGYNYPATDKAITAQLKKGITFSLPSPLEAELAKLLIKHIPCAEMVRFGKNGSDATSGAIRVARAVTKRDYVAVCGYHGWHDWYIGSTTRDLGVPQSTKEMTKKFEYNNIKSLEDLFQKYPNKFAAVIMEPENYETPQAGFLEKVKELTHKNGALLVFDEVITGFRWDLGGAQKYYGVTPDLASFGKSMANGMPISALVGKKQYMKVVEDIFYSFTSGGENLSIAAAIATIKEIGKKNVLDYIWKLGKKLQDGTNALAEKHGLGEIVHVIGKPCWQIVKIKGNEKYSDMEIKTYIQQEILEQGVLWYGSHNMSFAHKESDIKKLLSVYDKVFKKTADLLKNGKLKEAIRGGLISTVFKVR